MVGAKKSKSEGKKFKAAEKKQKQEKKGQKKENVKAAKANESDAEEDVDLEVVLAEYAKKQEQFLKVTEVPCKPPTARASSFLIASPSNENEVFLFGGEYFNGALATFFNDMFVYLISKDEWRLITSPNTPLPRSGHAMCRGGNAGGVYLFGGEFSSPKQGTFYHYNDFWRFEPSSREWTRIETKGKTPPARSGHRMTYFKNYIILFGGFQDTSQQTKYLADLWIYDTQSFLWHSPALPSVTQKPDARSSFSILPNESGAVLYGGYSRVKTTATGGQRKGGGQAQRNVLKPMVHQDCFFLRITQPAAGSPPNATPTVRWERRKKPANAPNPPPAGVTMAYHKGRGICFGGVHDVEESEEGIESEFFNKLFAWNIERNRFFPLSLRKPRNALEKRQGETRGGRRGRADANQDELLRNLAALGTGKSLADVEDMDIDKSNDTSNVDKIIVKEVSMEFPHPRFNAQLAVQDDVLYIYGGTFEEGDREYTLDDFYALDLGKLDGVKQIFRREPENWQGSDEEESEDEDDESGDDEDEEMDTNMTENTPKYSESSRKSKRKEGETVDDTKEPSSTQTSSVFDDTPDSTTTVSAPLDNLPHPRPFESRREYFRRTGNEWQEILMASWRWKGLQPETFSVKEIKTKAFEMSEEKWWDCREEVTALEDEQEAAGIGEVVTLVDRSEVSGGAVGRRR